MHSDLRGWLEEIEQKGELKRVKGANWDLEMSAIIEIMAGLEMEAKPAILFDEIPGFPAGFRTLFGLLGSPFRTAKTLCLEGKDTSRAGLLQAWRQKVKSFRPLAPVTVTTGPVCANVDSGEKVDLFKFPVPRFHELDGGRYFGTCHGMIQRDPDSGYVNVATYRNMLVDRNHLAVHILEGQHGAVIMNRKYFALKKRMPVAVAVGIDPTLWFAAFNRSVPWGVSEYDYAGGMKGEPLRVFKGEYSGLPLPADAEVVIEGECVPGEIVDEGPFGEWHGYYANMGLAPVPEPVINVKAVYYRDNPIFCCQLPTTPNLSLSNLPTALGTADGVWSRLEKTGIPGVKGVWSFAEVVGEALLLVVAIEQMYPGHSREAGLIASQYPHQNRLTIVVDDDIDPTNLKQVMWAVATRARPGEAIQILKRCRTNNSDPTISQSEKKKFKVTPKPLTNSRGVIDACRPLEWKDEWYPVCRMSPELRAKTLAKWQGLIDEISRRK